MKIENDLYQCVKCNVLQPKLNFHKNKSILGIRSTCKNCRTIDRKNFYKNNKEKELEYCKNYRIKFPEKRKNVCNNWARQNYKWFRELLNNIKNVPCLDCKDYFPFCAMDFDHKNPKEKLFTISEMQSKNENIIFEEIGKCEIVCANCHRIRTFKRINSGKLSYLSKIINPFKERPCADCHIQYMPYVMDFDHKNPKEKLFNISKPLKGNVKIIIEEIKKCDVVCANCHRIRTYIK